MTLIQSSNKDFLNRYSKAKKPLAHCVKVGNWQNSWRFQLENDMRMKPGQLHAVWFYKDHCLLEGQIMNTKSSQNKDH